MDPSKRGGTTQGCPNPNHHDRSPVFCPLFFFPFFRKRGRGAVDPRQLGIKSPVRKLLGKTCYVRKRSVSIQEAGRRKGEGREGILPWLGWPPALELQTVPGPSHRDWVILVVDMVDNATHEDHDGGACRVSSQPIPSIQKRKPVSPVGSRQGGTGNGILFLVLFGATVAHFGQELANMTSVAAGSY